MCDGDQREAYNQLLFPNFYEAKLCKLHRIRNVGKRGGQKFEAFLPRGWFLLEVSLMKEFESILLNESVQTPLLIYSIIMKYAQTENHVKISLFVFFSNHSI